MGFINKNKDVLIVGALEKISERTCKLLDG